MDELLAAAAAAMKMSEKMVQRSAEAKAKASGVAVEAVLAEWAGVEVSPAAAVVADTRPPAAPQAEVPVAAPVDSGSLLAAAAVAMKMPEKMVQRSAEAKAKASGVAVEAVLAEWAGVEVPEGASTATASAPEPGQAPSPAGPEPLEVAVFGKPDETFPPPERPAIVRATKEPVVPAGALPRWLVALFLVIPVFAIAYATFLPNGPNCGDAGRLGIDPVTGAAANCDGSALGSGGDPYTAGESVYESVGCSACHGAGGAGGGNFPGFTGGALLTTFPAGQCAAQIEWVTLGTNGWPGPTYGATSKPVGGSGAVMPAWGSVLTAEELHAVVVYERVAFGGEDLATALEDCAPPVDPATSALGG